MEYKYNTFFFLYFLYCRLHGERYTLLLSYQAQNYCQCQSQITGVCLNPDWWDEGIKWAIKMIDTIEFALPLGEIEMLFI